MPRNILRPGTTLALLLCCRLVSAAEVTIDPSLFKGDYNVGTGWIRGGAVRTFSFPDDSSQTISVGGSYPNEIRFHIDASGALASDSTRIAIDGQTIRFETVEVEVDPGLYDGRYNLLGYREGPATLHFVPAGTGTDDFGSRYALGNGQWPWQTTFDLDVAGNVVTDSTRLTVAANTITFVTVPTVVDPGAYTGQYNAGGRYRSGRQTVHLLPQGTGQHDLGSRWVLGNGSWPWSISYDLDELGNVATDSTRIGVQGNEITFLTVPVVLDLSDYLGRWQAPTGYLQGGQQHTMHLLPEGTGTMDFGSRWHMGNGHWPFAVSFDLDVAGNVLTDSSRVEVTGNSMRLLTVPIDVDPGAFTGDYAVDGVWISGPQTRQLVLAGTGTLDLGAAWAITVAGLPPAPFDLDNPCAVIPSETVTVGSGAGAIDFTVSCGDTIVDSDGDGVADTSDNCPSIANPDQLDQDDDGAGDLCDDDLDGDGVANAADNCPDLANPGQADLDGDGAGDACDDDADGDNVADEADNCPLVANPDQADGDGDAAGDACDDDDDNDGLDDTADNCPNTANPDQLDTDGDGEGDACDGDVDGDSVGNEVDLCPATPAGLPITEEGCSAEQWIDLACDPEAFPNHGRYVRCVAHVAGDLVEQGLISNPQRSGFVSRAAKR